MVYAPAVGRIVVRNPFVANRNQLRLRQTGPLSGARPLAGADAAKISRACVARARASVGSEASGTPLWLAAMRVAEGGDANAAVALVEALEPGSDEARCALSESRRSDEAEVEERHFGWPASQHVTVFRERYHSREPCFALALSPTRAASRALPGTKPHHCGGPRQQWRQAFQVR